MQALFDWFKWLFFDVSAARWDSEPFLVLTRFLLFLIVFAVLFAVTRAPQLQPLLGAQKNAGILIALVLALLAVIIVPASLLVTIMVSYGGLFSAVLILVPLAAAAWVLWFEASPLNQKEVDVAGTKVPAKSNDLFKALICIILFYTYGAYANTAFVLREGSDADKVFAYIADFAGIASVVFLFLFFYYLFEMFGQGSDTQKPFSWSSFKRFFGASDAQSLVQHVGARLAVLEMATKARDLDALRKIASEGPENTATLNRALADVVKEITELDVANRPAVPGFDPAKVDAQLQKLEKELGNLIDGVSKGWEDVETDALAAPAPPTPVWWKSTTKKVFDIRKHFDKLKSLLAVTESLIDRVQ